MKTRCVVILTAMGTVALAGAVWCATTVWNSTNFSMAERRWQPAPSGHLPGKDNGFGGPGHHPGDDCGICHGSNGIADSFVLTLTATVYDSRAARVPVEGVEVIFQDYAGNVFSMTSNDLGMMWTDVPMSGDTRLGAPSDSNTWRYKAWVREGDDARPMMTMPAVGGMMVPRMSCNMHHVTSGTLGGLWARSAGTLRSYAGTGLSYQKHIFPILRTKCGPCHIPGETVAEQGDDANPDVFDYGADLDLMTYGGSAVEVDGVVYAKDGIENVVDPADPGASLLFAKTLPGGTHGGGVFWTPDDADYRALYQWIAEGALDN